MRFLAKLSSEVAGFSPRQFPARITNVNRVTSLVRTEAIRLERFEHDAHMAHRDPERERAATHAISFVETGSFRVKAGGEWREVTSRHLFVANKGLEFSCAHETEYPDDCCLSLRFSDEAIESLRGQGVPTAGTPIVPLTNRRAYLKLRLGDATAGGDDARAEAMAGALYWSLSADTTEQSLFRAHQLSWYAARIDRANELIETQYGEPLSISQMARDAGMSVYHFARVFNELEGQPPHRRLLDVRLAEAQRRRREGATVTEACYGVGFGSLSHFVSTYRRHFGIRPSDTTK